MFTLAFGFGNPVEIAIIAGVVVLLFGGSKLAGFGKSLGEGIKGFKQGMNEEETEVKPHVLPEEETSVKTPSVSSVATGKSEETLKP